MWTRGPVGSHVTTLSLSEGRGEEEGVMYTLPLPTGPTCRCTTRGPPYKWKLNIPSFLQIQASQTVLGNQGVPIWRGEEGRGAEEEGGRRGREEEKGRRREGGREGGREGWMDGGVFKKQCCCAIKWLLTALPGNPGAPSSPFEPCGGGERWEGERGGKG